MTSTKLFQSNVSMEKGPFILLIAQWKLSNTERANVLTKIHAMLVFHFYSIKIIRDRIKRMHKIQRVEKKLMENTCSHIDLLEVSKFFKRKKSMASPSILFLMERSTQDLSHHQWMKSNFSKL